MSLIERTTFKVKSDIKKGTRDFVITWNNVKMVKQHSIRACVKEILNVAKSTGAVQLNLVGQPGQGKSTFALTVGHLVHELADVPFVIKKWGRDELINIEEEIKKLPGMNYFFLFDDISWLEANATPTQIKKIVKTLSEVRHLQSGDYQIISCFNFHYTNAVYKPLRNTSYWFYFSIGSSEPENVLKIVGSRNAEKINNFRRVHTEAQSVQKIFTYYFGKKFRMPYSYRKPFAPCLFWNGSQLRDIVFPSREFIAPLCDVCQVGNAIQKDDVTEMEDFSKDLISKYSIGVIRQALRVKLLTSYGINCYGKNVVNTLKYINDYMKHKPFAPQLLADKFELNETKTTRHTKIPDEIEAIPTKDQTAYPVVLEPIKSD